MKAQESFRAMMRDMIAPALRELGFKGSGQLFRLPDRDNWALMGFQKSVYSDVGQIRFTINLMVVPRELWEQERAKNPRLPARPSPNAVYNRWIWQQRIGKLLPERRDHWWHLGGTDLPEAQMAEHVLQAVSDYGLPAMNQEIKALASRNQTTRPD